VSSGRIRVALVGSGRQGRNLARLIAGDLSDEAELQVACDINEAAALAAKEELSFKDHCTDYRDALDREEVDAVIVAVPPGLHRDVCVAAAECGKHVFCEKPIAVELAHADEMISACERANVTLMIGYPFRYGDNRLTLRDLLLQGTIGRPVFWRERAPLSAESQGWLGKYELGGGSLFEYSHSIDFACYTFGRPQWVTAQLWTLTEDPAWETHNCYACLIKFESGDLYQISGFPVLPWRSFDNYPIPPFGGSHRVRENDIVGAQGAIYMGPDADGETSMVVTRHVGSERQELTTYPWQGWGGYSNVPALPMLAEFLDCIRTGNRETRNSGREARQTLTIIQAAIESSRTNKTVRLSDQA